MKTKLKPKISSQKSKPTNKQVLEGSAAIAHIINNIQPQVVSAYPITPQTHIVEDLAKLKADGEATYEYVRAESEFAAASIVTGAAATGVRTYTATSSQGLLLMAEVVFNIAGMRLPIVMTCANRGVSAPITIWNDHQDAMTVRDAGWIMLFAENHQEAIEQHLLAYKVAEKLNLPVMVNIDGFVLTHTHESVVIPSVAQIKKFLPAYKPAKGTYLDPEKPVTLGAFAAPAYYMEIRQELHDDLRKSADEINLQYENLKKTIPEAIKTSEASARHNTGLVEYYGPRNPKTILIAMGSVVGTIKDVIDTENKGLNLGGGVGILKIKCYRPFPEKEILELIKKADNVAIIEKSISLGATDGPLTLDVKAAAKNHCLAKVQGFIVGLGGRDITSQMIKDIIKKTKGNSDKMEFIGK